MSNKKEIELGLACDGISVRYNKDKYFFINQEDNQTEKWKIILEELGFKVTIEEEF
jgi:hypothetical protein